MEILVTDYCTDKWIFWANLSDSYVSEKTKKTGKTSDRHLTSNRAKHLRPSWVKKVEKKYRQSLEWDMLGYFSDIISKQNKCTKKKCDHLEELSCPFCHGRRRDVEWQCKFQKSTKAKVLKIKAQGTMYSFPEVVDYSFKLFLSVCWCQCVWYVMKRKEVRVARLFSFNWREKPQKWQKRGRSQRKLDAFWQMSVSELVPTLDLPHYKKDCFTVELEPRQQVSLSPSSKLWQFILECDARMWYLLQIFSRYQR